MERLDHFMARANAAYYATHDPFADFTTSPEVTQVFGEIVGLWAAVVWQLIGRPRPVLLVEAGPGRGTLMADALRAIGTVARDFRDALEVHLIESSPRLRRIQSERLADTTWHESLDTLPNAPLILIANEFLDALPIRQFVSRDDQWWERFVDHGRFVEAPSPDMLAHVNLSHPVGGVYEMREPALAFAESLGTRLSRHGGAALILDYGPEHSAPGDSLQALRNGRPTNPLSEPGSADITAHVDFEAFAATARKAGADVHGPIPQGIFLARLGLFQRTDRLAQTQSPARASALIEAARRLAEPNRMGRLFKVLALCQRGCPILPGFEADER